MRRGLEWYKRDQRAILDAIRAAKMTDRQAAIYNIIIDLIYDGGGETPDDPRHIASYLSNVGTAAARTTIQQLVEMGKLFRVGDMLHQERAENQAKTRRNLSETRSEIGRLGGVSSGISRREAKENNGLSEANASSKHEAEKRERREDRGGEGSARTREHPHAREANPPEAVPLPVMPDDAWRLYDLVVEAVGHRKSDVLPSRWMPPSAVIECSRFRGLGLNDDEIVAVAKGSRASFPEPPDGPKALERHMRNYAAAKAAPQLTPPAPNSITTLNAGGYNDRAAEQRRLEQSAIIAAAARGTTARGRT